MRKIIAGILATIILTLTMGTISVSADDTISILLIGDDALAETGATQFLSNICKSKNKKVSVEQKALPNLTFDKVSYIFNSDESLYMLRHGKYDYIVLNGNLFDGIRSDTDYNKAVKEAIDILTRNTSADVIFNMVPMRELDDGLCKESTQKNVIKLYENKAKEFNTKVVPTAKSMIEFSNIYKTTPYIFDKTLLNNLGSFIMASNIYSTIFGENASGAKLDDVLANGIYADFGKEDKNIINDICDITYKMTSSNALYKLGKISNSNDERSKGVNYKGSEKITTEKDLALTFETDSGAVKNELSPSKEYVPNTKEVEDFLNDLSKEDEKQNNKSDNDSIFYIIILSVIVVGFGVGVFFIVKNNKKSTKKK